MHGVMSAGRHKRRRLRILPGLALCTACQGCCITFRTSESLLGAMQLMISCLLAGLFDGPEHPALSVRTCILCVIGSRHAGRPTVHLSQGIALGSSGLQVVEHSRLLGVELPACDQQWRRRDLLRATRGMFPREVQMDSQLLRCMHDVCTSGWAEPV